MDLFFELFGDQIDGAREYQEDAFLSAFIDDDEGGTKSAALAIMADGMGGHAAGNIASNLVVSTFNKNFTSKFGQVEIAPLLRECLEKSNSALKESIKETPALDGMGCTMVAAALCKGKVYWLSVGDSHLYLIRDGQISKKNEDHSYGGYLDRMKAQGMEVEAEPGLSRNMLMSAMTGDEIAEIDCPPNGFQLLPGDRVIVASDGLDTLGGGTLLQTSTWSKSPKECVQALLSAVDEAKKPRQDNTTVLVIDAFEREAAEAATPADEARPGGERDSAQGTGPEEVDPSTARYRVEPALERGPRSRKPLKLVTFLVLLLGIGAGVYHFHQTGKLSLPWLEPGARVDPGAPGPVASAPKAPSTTPAPRPKPAPPPKSAPKTARPKPVPKPAPQPAPPPVAQPTPPAPSPPAAREIQDRLRVGGKGPAMVVVPGGSFQMGSSGISVNADERPRHVVKVKPFAIGKYEVTMAEYELFARSTGRRIPDSLGLDKKTHAAIFVTWDDAYAYTKWLSNQTGHRYRLPSEAEWEYAASAGTTTPYWWGFDPGENNAHCFDCKTGLNPRQATRVGRFEPNPLGLYDTAGNVSEWVHDCYHSNYQGAPDDGTVWEGGDCSKRVARGGNFANPSKSIRSAKRSKFNAQGRFDSVGFRVVREL